MLIDIMTLAIFVTVVIYIRLQLRCLLLANPGRSAADIPSKSFDVFFDEIDQLYKEGKIKNDELISCIKRRNLCLLIGRIIFGSSLIIVTFREFIATLTGLPL